MDVMALANIPLRLRFSAEVSSRLGQEEAIERIVKF